MSDLIVSSAQFENKSGGKDFNLTCIKKLAIRAKAQGSQVVAFHECCITGYTFASRLSRQELIDVSETLSPPGPSVQRLCQIAREVGIIILAGLFEKDFETVDGKQAAHIYNTYLCVSAEGTIIARFRKLHPFISPHLSAGNEYTVFELKSGWKAGILICYDNNVIENVRATALLGADIIFMPHVTMCTPSTRPGAGFVDPQLWLNRQSDPTSLRLEFEGAKGRGWLMKWLPARAYDNAVYVVFSNPIGMDDDQLKNGCSMVLDPFGDIIAECTDLDDQVVTARCGEDKMQQAGGWRYRKARRPELYRDIVGQDHASDLKVSWRVPDAK